MINYLQFSYIRNSILYLCLFFSFISIQAQDFKSQKFAITSANETSTLAIDQLGNLWFWGNFMAYTSSVDLSPVHLMPGTKV